MSCTPTPGVKVKLTKVLLVIDSAKVLLLVAFDRRNKLLEAAEMLLPLAVSPKFEAVVLGSASDEVATPPVNRYSASVAAWERGIETKERPTA